MGKSKQLVIITIAMFLLSAIWLSWTAQKQMDPDYQKNWWTLSFADPKNSSFDFMIANHSTQKKFNWKIVVDKETIKEGFVEINPGDETTVPIPSFSIIDKKMTVIVTAGEQQKEIYKINSSN